ncbi:MAG: hypothetical protein CL693_10835 [Cellvibrionaceae bacterium]|nr:hypothetical protein [Cellvibrionaceae bacterium]|tara:strand:- start:33581 stop:34405 length:825 start_codon:yes stop_codon:yes gene_type:complete
MNASLSLSSSYLFGLPRHTIWVAGLLSLLLHGLWLLGGRNELVEFTPLAGAKQALSLSLTHMALEAMAPEAAKPSSTVVNSPIRESSVDQPRRAQPRRAQPPIDEAPAAESLRLDNPQNTANAEPTVTATASNSPMPADSKGSADKIVSPSRPQPLEKVDPREKAAVSDQSQSANAQSKVSALIRQNPSFSRPPEPPIYPSIAIKRRWQGTVILHALVGAFGETSEIVIKRSSGYGLLDQAAMEAVSGWSFEPTIENGRAISSWVEVPVEFDLR